MVIKIKNNKAYTLTILSILTGDGTIRAKKSALSNIIVIHSNFKIL